MIFTPFETPEAALAACEAAGLQPLVGSDHQCGTKYGVCPPGFSSYINCYGDRDFLAWCNGHFRMVAMREAAGWEFRRPVGWVSPDDLTEDDWTEEERPFPEDEGFADWFRTYYHYDALDAGAAPNPYPNAPASADE